MIQTIRRLFGLEKRNLSRSDWFAPHSANGIYVDQTTAMGLPAVHACVRVIAETMGSLPLPTYKRLENGGRTKDRSHPNYVLLHDRPNPPQSSMEFWEGMCSDLCLWGWAYAEIQRLGNGTTAYLWPIPASNVQQQIKNGVRVFHLIRENRDITEQDMLAISNFQGKSPITLARETISCGLQAQRHGDSFFRNWGNQPAHYETVVDLTQKAKDKFLESKAKVFDGAENSGKEMVLPFGWKRVEHGMPNSDSQWLESRNFTRSEICAIFRVPPNLVGDLSRATFSNVEQMSLDFVQHCIRPLAVRIEQQINYKLYAESERAVWYSEFNLDGLLRADAVSRAAAFATQLQHGSLTINQWLAAENRNPVDPAIGDVPFILSTLVPVAKSIAQPEPPAPTPTKQEPTPAVRQVLKNELDRAQRRELRNLQEMAAKPGFADKLAEFYEGHRSYLMDALASPVAAFNSCGGNLDVQQLVEGVCSVEEELRLASDVSLSGPQLEGTVAAVIERRKMPV